MLIFWVLRHFSIPGSEGDTADDALAVLALTLWAVVVAGESVGVDASVTRKIAIVLKNAWWFLQLRLFIFSM